MKKILCFFTAMVCIAQVYAFSGGSFAIRKASEIYIPVGNNLRISLSDLSIIKENDYEKMAGKHLNFFEKISFHAAQKSLRKCINSDGTINSKRLSRVMEDENSPKGFDILGFALGFFLLPVGVLIAYLIKDKHTKRRIKSAWIGFGAGVLFLLIGLILALSSAFL